MSFSTPMADPQPLEVTASRHFLGWLAEHSISLACTTYQAGKLLLIGTGISGRLSVFERSFDRCMGMWTDGQTLWLASAYQLWRFTNLLPRGELVDGYDRLFVPLAGFTTGDLDVHDLALDATGRLIFTNTRFSCLAALTTNASFEPLWRPPFITRLLAEDRCHLNGLAMEAGQPRHVTVCGRSDVADGWRDQRAGGGCILDVSTGAVIAEGLCMPHSPRYHDGRLFVLNSGTGFLETVHPSNGTREQIAFCPGYPRGLALVGPYAVIGLSKPRERTFSGLELDANLAARNAVPWCGLIVVDVRTGTTAHWLRIEGAIQELYDVAILPGVRRPKALGFRTAEIQQNIWLEEGGTVSWCHRA